MDFYCGCCGAGPLKSGEWCDRCLEHVLQPEEGPFVAYHLRMYLAQFGMNCPYQGIGIIDTTPSDA